MHKLFILILVLLTACGKNSSELNEGRDLPVVVDPAVYSETVPTLATTFDVNLSLFNFSTDREDKINKAIDIIKQVVATEEFKDRILNFSYNGQTTFVDNNGYTNAEIYQKILDGAERLQAVKNNALDAEIELFFEDSSTVGYTSTTTTRIYMNMKFYDNYTAAGVAHNLFHEWMHKLGFNHAVSWSPSRDYSVPYAIGYIMGELGKNYL